MYNMLLVVGDLPPNQCHVDASYSLLSLFLSARQALLNNWDYAVQCLWWSIRAFKGEIPVGHKDAGLPDRMPPSLSHYHHYHHLSLSASTISMI